MNDYKIYVACLAAYNEGILHGAWINLNECNDSDDIHNLINDMLSKSPIPNAEEWAVHDTDGISGLDKLELGDMIKLNECDTPDLIMGLINQGVVNNIEDAIEYHENNYQGQHDSLSDYAQEFFESCGYLDDLPDLIKYHIDYESMGRDFELGGDIFTIESGRTIHVYTNA